MLLTLTGTICAAGSSPNSPTKQQWIQIKKYTPAYSTRMPNAHVIAAMEAYFKNNPGWNERGGKRARQDATTDYRDERVDCNRTPTKHRKKSWS